MNRADFVEGLRGGSAVALASAPFGALFGALAVENGLSLSETAFMSATVYMALARWSVSNSSVTMSTPG